MCEEWNFLRDDECQGYSQQQLKNAMLQKVISGKIEAKQSKNKMNLQIDGHDHTNKTR